MSIHLCVYIYIYTCDVLCTVYSILTYIYKNTKLVYHDLIRFITITIHLWRSPGISLASPFEASIGHLSSFSAHEISPESQRYHFLAQLSAPVEFVSYLMGAYDILS